MNTNRFNIITSTLAITNSLILGTIAFLTVFMFRQNSSEFASISGYIILICCVGSITTKFKHANKPLLIISAILDLILVLYVYNPTDYNSICDYTRSFVDINNLILIPLYAYLIIYYSIIFVPSCLKY